LDVDHIAKDEGQQVEFSSVLMVSDAGATKIGSPYLPGVSVRAVVESHGRAPKLVFGKFKKKKNYRRTYGHKQGFSTIKIEGFNGIG
jgi:large subunit ribosomal protein L21